MRVGLSPLQAGGDFEETIRECERAEAAGFDSVWLGEHHNNVLLYPTPLLGLAAIASRTRRAGRLGDAWLCGPSAKLDELANCVRLFREARTAAGHEAGDIALIRYVFVAETAERARAIAGAAFVRAFEETYFRWPHPVVKRPAGDLTIERLSQ